MRVLSLGGGALRTRWHVEDSNTGKWVSMTHGIWRQVHTFGVVQRAHNNAWWLDEGWMQLENLRTDLAWPITLAVVIITV